MSKIFIYKEITYELKETQGFYFCLVYDKGQKKILYQTKYFTSAERARSTAMVFIQDYVVFEGNKQKESSAQGTEPKRKKGKTKRKLKEVGTKPPIPKPQDEQNRIESLKQKQEDPRTDTSTLKERRSSALRSNTNAEIKSSQRLKSQDSRQERRGGIFTALLLVGAFLLIITVVAYGYSEYLENEGRQNLAITATTTTASSGLAIPLPPPRETIVLPQGSQLRTDTPTVTPTTTMTPTSTSTISSTRPPIKATNTQRPTDTPSATITLAPSPSATPTNTASPTLSPSPANTVTPTPTLSPTFTPTATAIPPTASVTP